MRLLVLGGTRFLSRSVAEQGVQRGWDVTCACRGSAPLPSGASHLAWDRSTNAPPELVDGAWDAVVDVARLPSHVRRGVDAVPDAHWVFVSTINVYADGGSAAVDSLVEPVTEDIDLADDPDAYGPMKVACEEIVTAGTGSSMIVRPGLIVGPGDGSGRFSYWPDRLVRGGEVLAPGSPDDVVQVIDVRDLAAWVLDACEARTTGSFDGVGEPVALGALLAEVAAGVGADPDLTWVESDFLETQGVAPWAGEGSIPLWLPRPEHDAMMSRSAQPAIGAGLRLRPLAETARDTLGETGTGITAERETEVLVAWGQRSPR